MKVKEFIEEYESLSKKKEYSPINHITINYLSYSRKIAMIKGIVDAASYIEISGKKIYKRNTPQMYFLFSMKLLETYTDIEIGTEKVVNEYDSLVSSGAMDAILSCIPASEKTILNGMLDMTVDDLENNTRSIVSFLETKMDSIDIAINTFLDVLEKPEIKAKITEFTK